MKSFLALLHREYIEHRGAFLIAPLGLVVLVLALAILAFTVNRVDIITTGQLATVVPNWVFEASYSGLATAWLLYLAFVLFFYCADGFAADKRNNAMLFWKSMPVSDFKVLLSKLVAAVTVLPGSVFAVALLSLALLFGVTYIGSMIAGLADGALFGSILGVFAQMSLLFVTITVCGLIWYLPYMALVGSMATAVGRWAIPISFLVPTVISSLEWVVSGGPHPFSTRTWDFLDYRSRLPLDTDYVGALIDDGQSFSAEAFRNQFIANYDWTQAGIGVVVALVLIYLASEYRRRSAAN